MAYISRYERLIQKSLLQELKGQELEIKEDQFVYVTSPEEKKYNFSTLSNSAESEDVISWSGAIPSLIQEINFYKKLNPQTELHQHQISKSIEFANQQLKESIELQKFFEQELSQRDHTPDFELMFSDEDCVSCASFYQNFILN